MAGPSQVLYWERNEGIRLEVIDLLDEERQGEVLEFFRVLDVLHVYWEYLLPSARQGDAFAIAAVLQRPWPPWGVGAVQIHGLFCVYPLDETRAGVGCVLVRPEQLGNIGMVAALYKEALDETRRQGHKQIACLVRDHAALVDRALRKVGFSPTDDDESGFYLSEGTRYGLYVAEPEAVLGALGLEALNERRLLGFEFDDATADGMAGFYPALHASMQAWMRDPYGPAELRPILSGLVEGYEPGTP